MAHMLVSYPSTTVKCGGFSRGVPPWERRQSRAVGVVQCCSCSSTEEVGVFGKVENESKRSKSRSREIKEIDNNKENDENKLDCLVSEFGWEVRRLVVEDDEMRRVAFVQAQAFHIPVFLFNDLFFDFFQAEVLSGLLYKLKNSPPDRYACLVAEPATNSSRESQGKLVGVVDVTVQRDAPVLQHLQGAQEYLYISGLAVSKSFRCHILSIYVTFSEFWVSDMDGFEIHQKHFLRFRRNIETILMRPKETENSKCAAESL